VCPRAGKAGCLRRCDGDLRSHERPIDPIGTTRDRSRTMSRRLQVHGPPVRCHCRPLTGSHREGYTVSSCLACAREVPPHLPPSMVVWSRSCSASGTGPCVPVRCLQVAGLLPEPRERGVVREAACGGRDCPYLEAGAGVDVLGAGAVGAGAGVGADGAGAGVEVLGVGVTAAWT